MRIIISDLVNKLLCSETYDEKLVIGEKMIKLDLS